MACEDNNATPPGPAIAPGVEHIDPTTVARQTRVDPRLPQLVPGFDAPFFQAGLAGYSDAAMRIIARRHGCPCCVTEALLDRTLLAGGKGFDKADLGELADNVPGGIEDQPLVGQIMGSDPDEMAAAAVKMIEQGRRPPPAYRRLAERKKFTSDLAGVTSETGTLSEQYPATEFWNHDRDALRVERKEVELGFATIDVNLACPVKKIKAKARGGHWLREPDGAIDILKAVRAALPREIPCTLKIRRGSDDSPEAERNFFRIFDAAYEIGYAWATVHGRTVEQKYVGPSRWTFLRDLVKSRSDRLIFGSGDVWEVHDIFRMIAYTGVHGVSVARGCIGNPWIFRQARQMMAGLVPAAPTIAEQRDVLLQHFELSVAVNGEGAASRLMRKFGIRFAQHHPRGEEVRVRFIHCKGIEDWKSILDEHYSSESVLRA